MLKVGVVVWGLKAFFLQISLIIWLLLPCHGLLRLNKCIGGKEGGPFSEASQTTEVPGRTKRNISTIPFLSSQCVNVGVLPSPDQASCSLAAFISNQCPISELGSARRS